MLSDVISTNSPSLMNSIAGKFPQLLGMADGMHTLALAGGRGLGFRHGRYLRFGDEIPLSNLFVT